METPGDTYALGHPFFTWLPNLVVLQTIWVREHNRVCSLLVKENPHWDDERVYQTTRNILNGIQSTIVVKDYVQHLSGFHLKLVYDPDLLPNVPHYGTNKVRQEYNYLYHWHALIPDYWKVGKYNYSHVDFFGKSSLLRKHGITEFVYSMAEQQAGEISRHNFAEDVRIVITETLLESRKLRIRPLNEYRKYYNLPPHKTFLEMTGGDKELAGHLEKWYGHIDAVEMFTGFFAEPTQELGLTPETITVMGSPFALSGLYTLPYSAPTWWKPSTYGGETGWKIVRETTFDDFICRNLVFPKGQECDRDLIGFIFRGYKGYPTEKSDL